jgi:hypothetical protein
LAVTGAESFHESSRFRPDGASSPELDVKYSASRPAASEDAPLLFEIEATLFCAETRRRLCLARDDAASVANTILLIASLVGRGAYPMWVCECDGFFCAVVLRWDVNL